MSGAAAPRGSGPSRALVTTLGVLTLCCWGALVALLGLAAFFSSFSDDATPPPRSSFPTAPGVSISEGNSGGYCGSGGCFSTELIASSSDGAARPVTVNRIVEALLDRGWQVTETDWFEETRIAATGDDVAVRLNWVERPDQVSSDDLDQYDPTTEVKIVMDWAGADHPTGAETLSFQPGTFFGNWLIVAGLLTFATVAVLTTRARRVGQRGALTMGSLETESSEPGPAGDAPSAPAGDDAWPGHE